MVSLQFTVPRCSGDWDMALVVGQTPISGQRFVLWSLDEVRLSGSGGDCVALDVCELANAYNDAGSFDACINPSGEPTPAPLIGDVECGNSVTVQNADGA